MRIRDVLEKSDFVFGLCQFLEEYRHNEEPYKMICDEPSGDYDIAHLCIIAAVARKLAKDSGLKTPDWVESSKYVSEFPIYAFDTKNEDFRAYLRQSSPAEFARHNVYYGLNALDRV